MPPAAAPRPVAPEAAPQAPEVAPPPRPRPPFMERLGVRYLRSLAERQPVAEGGGEVHLLDARERSQLKAIERGAVLRAFCAGALSATVAAVAEVLATPLLGADPDRATVADQVRFWLVVGPAIGVAAVGELAYLTWDSLRSVHALSRAAGLQLLRQDADPRLTVAAALARAALELPNPNESVLGVDPRREASRIRLLVSSILYKAKVGATNYLLKAVVRRIMGRSAVRAVLAFVAVPVTGFWDAFVSFRVMREARVRAMGPSAVNEYLNETLGGEPALSPGARLAVVRAVASSIVRSSDLHPNLVALLTGVVARVGHPGAAPLDDSRVFLASLPALSPAEQVVVLRVLSVAAIIDGKLAGAEKRLVREALAACGRAPDDGPLKRLRRSFLSGDPVTRSELEALAA